MQEESQVLHKIYSSVRAVNKKDESEIRAREEPCSLLPGLESMAAWL